MCFYTSSLVASTLKSNKDLTFFLLGIVGTQQPLVLQQKVTFLSKAVRRVTLVTQCDCRRKKFCFSPADGATFLAEVQIVE
jgi:hypothetical protein